LVRLSSAALPVLKVGAQPLAPGMGLKFLRDGVESANLVSMLGVNGQPGEWNFFEHTFTNHIPNAKGAALDAVAAKFSTATDYITSVGLSDYAKYDQSGNEETPVFPYELFFVPDASIANVNSNSMPSDPLQFLDQLKAVPANNVLYNVYALNAPTQ